MRRQVQLLVGIVALLVLLTQCAADFPDTAPGIVDLGGGLVMEDGKVRDVWSGPDPLAPIASGAMR